MHDNFKKGKIFCRRGNEMPGHNTVEEIIRGNKKNILKYS